MKYKIVSQIKSELERLKDKRTKLRNTKIKNHDIYLQLVTLELILNKTLRQISAIKVINKKIIN